MKAWIGSWAVALPLMAFAQHEGHLPERSEPPLPDGYAEVRISPDRQQLIGIKTAPVERAVLTGTIRAAAVITADETREVQVQSKLMGWVDRLYVNAVGQTVKKGDPLYALYSQELYATQQEYLRVRSTMPSLARAARTRLKLWDVPEDQIRAIEAKGPRRSIVFRSPISGTVLEKQVLEGQAVGPEMMLYRIADLSEVWVVAEVYEYEVSRIDPEGSARVQVQGVRESATARVDYVYPTVNETTRTIRVRLRVANPSGELRPGSFANVDLPARPLDALWVPEAAIVDTGVRKVVYVALDGGRFRPTEVEVGRRVAGKAEVVRGLDAQARVVVSAQFLIDSESRLRGTTGQGPPHGGH